MTQKVFINVFSMVKYQCSRLGPWVDDPQNPDYVIDHQAFNPRKDHFNQLMDMILKAQCMTTNTSLGDFTGLAVDYSNSSLTTAER